MKKCLQLLLISTSLLLFSAAWGEVATTYRIPKAGATLEHSPKQIFIQFDRAVKPPPTSELRVENAFKKAVITVAKLNSKKPDVLLAALPTLAPGVYHVYWDVVADNGERTKGDYEFIVR